MRLVTFEMLPRDASEGGGRHALNDASLGLEGLEPSRQGLHRLGALIETGVPGAEAVIDLNRAFAVKLALEDVGAPEAEADSLLPAALMPLLQRGDEAIALARDIVEWTILAMDRYDGPDLRRADVVIAREDVRLNAPLPQPGKVIGVARNYAAHAAERGQQEPPKEPVLFIKATSAVTGPFDDVRIPPASNEVDYEGELAVVIGTPAQDVSSHEALRYVAGYSIANDVTARDFQNVRGQHFLGKSCDTFAPMGPALVTLDEIPDPQALGIRTLVNSELRQDGSTAQMIFPVAEIIAFASRLMTLTPGDVILTGTPSGVGAASEPPRWLKSGDRVAVEIEALGRIENTIRA